ncbi:MAG: hydrolase, partial [Pseudomonadales bacterium]|nr:hydrolase [Pseudomonadales bacterium]
HMDTVFSQSHPFQTPQFIDDNTLNGPGVTDMKGGLCVILHALKAFEQSSVANNIGWDVFINADEEIGSPASGPFLENIASQYQCALVYEPAMTPEGTLAYERKGSGKFTLTVQGVAAHAGRDFDKGRNAISHLAKLIVAVDKLNGQRDDLTINIGLISGGSALNMVPDMAVTKLDVRYKNAEDKPWLMMQLKQLVSEFNQAGEYEVQLHGNFGRPAKTVSPHCHDLFETIRAIAKSMGLTLDWKDSGGCCDGNNLALSGIPVVDTLGVRGGNIHSSEEYLLVDSLVERAQLSSLLLMHLAKE